MKEDNKFLINIILLLGMFYVLNTLFFLNKLSESAYFEKIIIVQALQSPVIIGELLIGCILVFFRKRIRWTDIDPDQSFKWLVGTCIVVLCWKYSAYAYNFYYDQAHYLDRFALILLGVLAFRNPIYVHFFLILCLLIVFQFHHPLGPLTWTDKKLIFDFLVLFDAFLFIKILHPKITKRSFFVLALSMFAAHYYVPALSKLRLDQNLFAWIIHSHPENLFIASYNHGWLMFFKKDLILNIAKPLMYFREFLAVVALVIEFAVLLLLFNRRITILVQWLLILLHIIIVLSSGIFFWKWILLNFALMIFILKIKKDELYKFYNPFNMIVFLLIVLFSKNYFTPVKLGWFDSPFTNHFEIEAIDEKDQRFAIGTNFMEPYDIIFSQNRFSYLSRAPLISGTYAAVMNLEELLWIERYGREGAFDELKKKLKRTSYNERKAKKFDLFIKNYFSNLNRKGRKGIFINKVRAPCHIITFSRAPHYTIKNKIKTIHIRYKEEFYNKGDISVLTDKIIRTIDIPQIP